MAREKVTVTVANVKLNMLTTDAESVRRLAASVDARLSRIEKKMKGSTLDALVTLVMEQAESQKKTAELVRSQQEEIFALLSKNAALLGQEVESGPYQRTENALLAENTRLQKKNAELLDELVAIRAAEEDE